MVNKKKIEKKEGLKLLKRNIKSNKNDLNNIFFLQKKNKKKIKYDKMNGDLCEVSKHIIQKCPQVLKENIVQTRHYSSTGSEDDSDYEHNDYNKKNKIKSKITRKQEMELKKIYEIIKKKTINEKKILESDILFELKIECIELMTILNNLDKNSEEYYKLKKKIYENINDETIKKITKSNHNDKIKQILYKKYEKIRGMEKNDEYYKMMEWINTTLNVPTEIKNIMKSLSILDQLCEISKKMDTKMFGLYNVKEKILETYASIMTNKIGNNKCIALVGPPGTGKTSFAKCIADALELPFEHISMGGIKDSSNIVGHNSTYVGSKAGIIVESLIKMKYKNGVLLLDEFDKISDSSEGLEIYSNMLHILDYTQNNRFRDTYLSDINIDLSHLLIIITMNDESKLNNALIDRLSIIKINGYTNCEKKDIASNFIIKKIMKIYNITNKEIIIEDHIINYIINKYAGKENGVRELERCFYIIFEKINILKIINNKQSDIVLSYKIKNFKLPFKLTHEIVDILLEKSFNSLSIV